MLQGLVRWYFITYIFLVWPDLSPLHFFTVRQRDILKSPLKHFNRGHLTVHTDNCIHVHTVQRLQESLSYAIKIKMQITLLKLSCTVAVQLPAMKSVIWNTKSNKHQAVLIMSNWKPSLYKYWTVQTQWILI